jgi:hypothetical protein
MSLCAPGRAASTSDDRAGIDVVYLLAFESVIVVGVQDEHLVGRVGSCPLVPRQT